MVRHLKCNDHQKYGSRVQIPTVFLVLGLNRLVKVVIETLGEGNHLVNAEICGSQDVLGGRLAHYNWERAHAAP